MARIVAVANQKGGVGKTTTTVNLGACMAAAGRRVLLVDLDPQGNATSSLGLDKAVLEHTVYDVLVGEEPAGSTILPTGFERLDILPANKNLVGASVELVQAEQREFRLKKALESVSMDYNYVYIDCPPALNLLTVNALTAANGVLVTLQCEFFALEGLSELIHTITRVRDRLNPSLGLEGVLLTMYQYTNLSNQVIEDVRGHFRNKVFQTVIPRNVTLAEAPSYGKPIIYYDLKSAGAKAYLALAREVVARG